MFIFSQTEGIRFTSAPPTWWLRQEIAKFETWDHEKASLVLVQKLMDDLREKPPVMTPMIPDDLSRLQTRGICSKEH